MKLVALDIRDVVVLVGLAMLGGGLAMIAVPLALIVVGSLLFVAGSRPPVRRA
jgi:hypothetical protein